MQKNHNNFKPFPIGFYGIVGFFSDFAPVESEVATYDAQKAVHIALEQILSASENVLSLLELSMDADQAYDWNSCNSLMPELNEIYAKCYKKTNRFLFLPLCRQSGPTVTELLENVVRYEGRIAQRAKENSSDG